MRDEIADELRQWNRDMDAFLERISEEQEELHTRRWELLLRARDAGMTNKEIAQAWSVPDDPGFLAPEVTPQRVTALMREAEAHLKHQAYRFVRAALEPDDE